MEEQEQTERGRRFAAAALRAWRVQEWEGRRHAVSTRHNLLILGGLMQSTIAKLHFANDLPTRMARAIIRWASPTAQEEKFSWQYLAQCERVLDVACGIGSFIAEHPEKTTGIDVNQRNVSACRVRGLNVYHGNALALEFPDNSFDGVHSAHVLFALPAMDAVQYLRELVRVTRPDGMISISTLCDVNEVFKYPEVARPYPPQAIFRMIDNVSRTDVGTDVPGVTFVAIMFRRPPLFNFRFDGSPRLWRVAALVNALQLGCGLRKLWTYSGYTIVLRKKPEPTP